MATVLWVLMEALRYVGVCSQPVTPSIARALLDQLGVAADCRSFADLDLETSKIVGGPPLPKPLIIVPRYEPAESEEVVEQEVTGAPDMAAPPDAVSDEALAVLESQVREQTERVRLAKQEVG